MARAVASVVVPLVLVLAGAGAAARAVEDRWIVHDLRYEQTRSTTASPLEARAPARTAATWCGTPTPTDLAPNAVAGNPLHWVYAIPSDGADRFGSYGSLMQTDAESIDAWWRTQDAARVPRNDVAPFSCGLQLDLSLIRLSLSGSQLGDVDRRFGAIADGLIALQFSSRFTKYLVYYDGPVEPDVCGQGGSDSTGLGFAVVYVQACTGVPLSTTAAHELLHTFGAVPRGAPHMCPEPNGGHVCDKPLDMMFPFGDETPITGLALDSGRDDYYAHSGAWPDTQDSPWLAQLDRQVPFALTISGPGSVRADVPGLQCAQNCTTTWNAGTALALTAAPAAGAKLVRWSAGCSGSVGCNVAVNPGTTVSAFFAPRDYRLKVAVSGRGSVRSSRPGISCPQRCSSLVPSHQATRLAATPTKGWRFKQWRGACRGTKAVCSVPMTANTSAQAVFVQAR